jgi:hypothetical protein
MGKTERQNVRVENIVEYPTRLGSRCALLRELGYDAYSDTEEELIEVLTDSARRPERLGICLKDSRCRAFWEVFQEGRTPFVERDPIHLLEYRGRYWAVEGKHRVCLAKRAGIEVLEARVYLLEEDTMTMLKPEGKPGRYCFYFSCTMGSGSIEEVQGDVALLWVNHPGFSWRTFFGWAWLDVSMDTRGKWEEIIPGLRYRVSVGRKLERRLFFRLRKQFTVDSEVEIAPEHSKTKIWLLKVPAEDALGMRLHSGNLLQLGTVYRFGCWRQHHLKQLERIFPNLR